MGDTVPELASRCREREFLGGFLDGYIEHDHHDVDFGDTDLALVEKILEQIEQGQNLLVVNPFSYPLIPALIAASYILSTDVRVGGDQRVTQASPMVLLPKEGYIQELEGFNYHDTVSGGGILPKINVGAPDDFEGEPKVHRVTDIGFITDSPGGWHIGLLFVDLRKDIWKNELTAIEEFTERNDVGSVVFYTDSRDFATEIIEDMVDDTMEVSRTAMMEASPGDLGANPTRGRIQERILDEGVDSSVITVQAPDLMDEFDELYRLRNEIKQEIQDLHAVPKLHNLLVELAVKPSTYDEQVRGNFYYNSTTQLIEGIQSFIEQVDETEVSLLENFWRKGQQIRDHLERSNPRWKILMEQVEEALHSDREFCFVAKNRPHRDAIQSELFTEGYELDDRTRVLTRNEVRPSLDTTFVFVNLPGYRHPLYEFPPSTEVRFMIYPFLESVVQKEFDKAESTDEGDRQVVTLDQTERIGEPETVSLEPLDIETDVDAAFSSPSSGVGGDGSKTTGAESEDGFDIEIAFGDGTSVTVDSRTRMTILDQEKDAVHRQRAEELSPGDRVVLMDEAATDLYEMITRQQHEREAIRRREKLIERWREILNEGLEERFTPEELHAEMVERGSERKQPISIEMWAAGDVIGPADPKDVRLVLEILRPGSESAYEEIVSAMKYIRALHTRIGMRVKRIIEVEIDPTRSAHFDSGIGSKLDDIEDKIDVKRVNGTTAL